MTDACTLCLCIFFPPIGVLVMKGCSGDFFLNWLLCIFFWFPGMIHALYVYSEENKKMEELERKAAGHPSSVVVMGSHPYQTSGQQGYPGSPVMGHSPYYAAPQPYGQGGPPQMMYSPQPGNMPPSQMYAPAPQSSQPLQQQQQPHPYSSPMPHGQGNANQSSSASMNAPVYNPPVAPSSPPYQKNEYKQ